MEAKTKEDFLLMLMQKIFNVSPLIVLNKTVSYLRTAPTVDAVS